MPITVHGPDLSFSLYYSLIGQAGRPKSPNYRSNNPWKIANEFCHDLANAYPGLVSAVTTQDDSVFQVFLLAAGLPATPQAFATTVLNDLAAAIAPPIQGDTLVAVVADGGNMIEVVHS